VSSRAVVPSRLAALLSSLCVALIVLGAGGGSAFASPPTFLGSAVVAGRPTGMAVEESTGNVLVAEDEGPEALKVLGEAGGRPGVPPRP
jgi:hypothetical protein